MKLYVKTGLIITFIFWSGCNAPKINLAAMELENMKGKPREMSNYKGDVVFLNFWATWCAPCMREMPEIAKAAGILRKEDIRFIMVSDESEETIKDFVNKNDFDMEYLRSLHKLKDAGILSLPQTFILNRKGEIMESYSRSRDWSSEESLQLLRNYIDQK